MRFERAVRALGMESGLDVQSSEDLAAKVHEIAKNLARGNNAYNYRKRPREVPFSVGLTTTPASVLHELGLATTFFTQSPFVDIARHWANVRYCGTLTTTRQGMLALSREGNESVVHHHKTTQSEHLGIGLALIVAKAILRQTYPDWEFSAVDAEVALSAGSIDGVGTVRQLEVTKNRPDYFLLGRRLDGQSRRTKIVVLECKGTHSDKSFAMQQLAKACVQVQTVEVGHSVPPGLMVASCLSPMGITAHVLDPPGEDDLWSAPEEEMDELLAADPGESALQVREVTHEQITAMQEGWDDASSSGVISPRTLPKLGDAADELPDEPLEVVQIPEDRRAWLLQILARTAAASALFFIGENRTAVNYTTSRQRGISGQQDQLPYPEDDFDRLESTIHAKHALIDAEFIGTEHVMPLPGGRRLEVFRGIDTQLYRLLADGKIGPYFRAASRKHKEWLTRDGRPGQSAGSILSLKPDGTALRLRIV